MKQQFNGGSMEEIRIKSFIIQYDDAIRYQKKLLDCYFAEALLSVLPMCMNDPEELETRLDIKTKECERYKKSLESARDRVAKLYTQNEENTSMKEFLDFAVFLSTFRDFNEDVDTLSNFGKEDLLQYLDISLENNFSNKLNNRDEYKLNGGKSLPSEITGEGKRSKLPFHVIHEDILTLNSKLELAQESLNAERFRRKQLECERDNLDYFSEKLCCLLFDYLKCTSIPVETKKMTGQTSYGNDHLNVKAVYESCGLLTTRNTSQPDIEYYYGELTSSSSLRFQVNYPLKRGIDSESTLSKTSKRNPEKRFQQPIRVTRLTNDEWAIKKNSESLNVNNTSHKTINDEAWKFRCNICNPTCSSEHNLERHICQIHDKKELQKWSMRAKRSAQEASSKMRTSVHGSEKRFKCSVCRKQFKRVSVKKRRQRIFHEDVRFQCAHCDKRYDQKIDLTHHIHSHHSSLFQKQFKCTFCDKSFMYESFLKMHQLIHQSKKPFKCSTCKLSFKRFSHKIRHEWKFHNTKRVSFKCARCEKAYHFKWNLNHHMQVAHAEK